MNVRNDLILISDNCVLYLILGKFPKISYVRQEVCSYLEYSAKTILTFSIIQVIFRVMINDNQM